MTRRTVPLGQHCPTCDQTHTRCAAHRKTARGGGPCMQHPGAGAQVCRTHGGSSPQALTAADRRLTLRAQQDAMTNALALAYGTNPPPVDPAEAMLCGCQTTGDVSVPWLVREVEARQTQQRIDEMHATAKRAAESHALPVRPARPKRTPELEADIAATREFIKQRRIELEGKHGI